MNLFGIYHTRINWSVIIFLSFQFSNKRNEGNCKYPPSVMLDWILQTTDWTYIFRYTAGNLSNGLFLKTTTMNEFYFIFSICWFVKRTEIKMYIYNLVTFWYKTINLDSLYEWVTNHWIIHEWIWLSWWKNIRNWKGVSFKLPNDYYMLFEENEHEF
jgi:hypothetical protein